MAKMLNATATDLSNFKKADGRMIMYQGWADPAVTPLRTLVYYEDVVKAMGGLEQTIDFFRLYLVPGMAHCLIPRGVGPDYFDLLKPLEDWVEKGLVPNEIIASPKDKEGNINRTRPLCVTPRCPGTPVPAIRMRQRAFVVSHRNKRYLTQLVSRALVVHRLPDILLDALGCHLARIILFAPFISPNHQSYYISTNSV